MFLLGLRLEKTVATFGQIVAAGGLAILYVAAFAAYSFEPLKVIDSPWLGLALQLLGVLAMAAFAIQKRSEPLATLAILLGFVSCWFSHAYDLHSFTLAGLNLFAFVAGALFFRWRWVSPLVVAMAGSYAGYVLLVFTHWSDQPPSPLVTLSGLFNLCAIFFAAIHATHLFRGPLPDDKRSLGVLANSSLATVAGVVAFAILHSHDLKWFYLALTIALLLMAGIEFLRPRLGYLCLSLFLKAATAFAIYLVLAFDGPTEWLALSLQAGLLLYALHRSGSVWLEHAYVLLWLAAMAFAYRDWDFPGSFGFQHLAGLFFILIQTSTLAIYQRWQAGNEKPRARTAVLAVLGGIQLGQLHLGLGIGDWQGPVMVCVVAAVALLSLALRSWVPAAVSAAAMAVKAVGFAITKDAQAVFSAPGLLTATALMIAGLTGAEFLRRMVPAGTRRDLLRFWAIFHATFVFGTLLFFWGRLGGALVPIILTNYAGWALVAAGILAWHAWGHENGGELRVVIALALGFALMLPAARFVDGLPYPIVEVAFAIAGVVVLTACFLTRDLVPVITAMFLAVAYAGHISFGLKAIPAWHYFAVLAPGPLILTALWRFAGLRPAVWAGAQIAIIGAANQLHLRFGGVPTGAEFASDLAFGLSLLACGWLVASAGKDRFTNDATRAAALWAYPLVAVVLLFSAFAWDGSPAVRVATALWGLTGIVIFAGGLILRRRAHRIVGLLGLALCVIRVFAVDLSDTFYRIIAFGVVAVVLLVIGYLYTRFREFLERDEAS